MFNPFPSVCACCRNALFYCALFHQSLYSVFTAVALPFLVSQLAEATGCSVLLLHSNILPLVCDWAEGPCEFCTISFPTSPFHMTAKGDLSKNACLMLMGVKRSPYKIFMKLNLFCVLRLA